MEANSSENTLRLLRDKDVRFGTAVDIGSADGTYFLHMHRLGLLPDAVIFNVDPNPLYEPSLERIREVLGGGYSICALSDRIGTTELTLGAHPYWSTLRSAEEAYWRRVNNVTTGKTTVPTTTLDELVHRLKLKPPFLLKLDVQGAEATVLQGAEQALAETLAVIVEADVDDFDAINDAMRRNGFTLYDVTGISRTADGSLGWFHPIYLASSLKHIRPRGFFEEASNQSVVEQQIARRDALMQVSKGYLDFLASQAETKNAETKVSRNSPCPCGSGRRFKHCCGAHGATSSLDGLRSQVGDF